MRKCMKYVRPTKAIIHNYFMSSICQSSKRAHTKGKRGAKKKKMCATSRQEDADAVEPEVRKYNNTIIVTEIIAMNRPNTSIGELFNDFCQAHT